MLGVRENPFGNLNELDKLLKTKGFVVSVKKELVVKLKLKRYSRPDNANSDCTKLLVAKTVCCNEKRDTPEK
jgi:hypothetical protein